MKLFKSIFCMTAASLICFTASAGEDYTMPNGRILRNAYIVETKANGVVVGHSTGVMFVKYKKMPGSLRKELGFDQAKYDKYMKKLHKRKAARRKKLAAQKAATAKFRKDLSARQRKYRITALADKIKSTELRIQRLKQEIPKLESDSRNFLNKAVSLASGSQSSSGAFGRGGFWRSPSNRSNRRSASRREVKKRFKAAEAVGEEYSTAKFRLQNYKDELDRKTLQLEQMKRQLAALKNQQAAKEKRTGLLDGIL